MLEIPERIWKKIKGYSKPQKGFRTNSENVLCWKTVQRADKKPVVIKLFEWEVIEEDTPDSKTKALLQKISHPHLIKVLDIQENDELGVYYVMEYGGDNLREFMKSPSRQDWVIDVITQTLEGLTELYRHRLVHRDIKPENILINKDGVAKLGDYGLVKLQRYVTKLTTIAGTRDYMAPEILEGKTYDKRCDIYSVGVVLRELLTWESPPFKSDDKPNDILDNLWQVILKATAKEPEKRFDSTQEFLNTLNNINLNSILLDDVIVPKKPTSTKKKGRQPSKKGKLSEPINQTLNFQRGTIQFKSFPGLLIQNLQTQFYQSQRDNNIGDAIKVGTELIQAIKNQSGPSDSYLAVIWVALANLYCRQKDYKNAESAYIAARGIDLRTKGENSAEHVSDLFYLAELYQEKQDYLKARTYYQDALRISDIVSKDKAVILMQTCVLVFTPFFKRKLTESELQEYCIYYTKAIISNQLGVVNYILGEYDTAVRYYNSALQLNENIFQMEPGEPMAINLYNLGLAYEAKNNMPSAEPLYKQALEIAKKVMDPNDERLKRLQEIVLWPYK